MKRKIEIARDGYSEQVRVGSEEDSAINNWTGQKYSSKYYEILAKRKALPVYEFKEDLLNKVKNNQIVIIEGETGSG